MLRFPVLSKLIKIVKYGSTHIYFLASASLSHKSSNLLYSFLNIHLASAQNDLRSSVHRSTYLTSVLHLTQTFYSQSNQRWTTYTDKHFKARREYRAYLVCLLLLQIKEAHKDFARSHRWLVVILRL